MLFNKIVSPLNHSDFDDYYYFRWKYLRKDLNKKLGSERDALEDISIHRMVNDNNGNIIGVGRIHKISRGTYQVRYFAIHKDYRRIGLGTYLMADLEKIAINEKAKFIVLNARENALNFYQKLNYKIIKKTNLLYNKIQHYQMKKKII